MTKHARLDNVSHADLKVAVRYGAAFGDAVNQLLVFPTEFEQLQRDYPILFRRDAGGSFYAVVLLGLDLDENLFLGPDGWQSRYIPALRQRGPFVGGAPQADAAPDIHIDLEDPRVGADDGEALFLRHGGQGPYLRHVAAVLEAVGRGHAAAPGFFAALEEHGLIRPATLKIEIEDGASYLIDEVYTVSEDALAALGGAALERLHAGGVLRAATMAASSLGNIERLIDLKNRKAAGR